MKESKFAFIASHPGEYGVSDMCRALGVTRQGYYQWAKRPASAHDLRDLELARLIGDEYEASRGIYDTGHPQGFRKAQDVRHQAGIRPSMGSISSPRDNAVTESLMGVIKSECVHARTYDTREQAALDIFDYIECFYNRIRIHSALGWLSPAQFEKRMAMRNRPEAA